MSELAQAASLPLTGRFNYSNLHGDKAMLTANVGKTKEVFALALVPSGNVGIASVAHTGSNY